MIGLRLTQSPVKSVTSVRDQTPCASIPDKRAFISALYDHIADDEVMPLSGKVALASLHVGSPTFAFRRNEGAVLKFDILDFPGSVEAYQATALLIQAGVAAAAEFDLCLNGIEVVFYQNKQRLWLVFKAKPPWRAKDISLVPLGRRGD
jgi:hypothetical protein